MDGFLLSLPKGISLELIAPREEDADGGAYLWVFLGLISMIDRLDFQVAEPGLHGVQDGPDMALVLPLEFLHAVAQGYLLA